MLEPASVVRDASDAGGPGPHLAFEFELDPAAESYAPGAPVSGTLHVRVLRDVVPESLTLRLVTVTETSQVSPARVHALLSLPAGRWRSGETHRFDFAFAIPDEPAYSYEGPVVSLTWYLEAEAQVLWEVSTVARHALRVVPRDEWRLDVRVAGRNAPRVRAEELVAGAITSVLVMTAVVFLAPPAFMEAALCVLPLVGFLAPVLLSRVLWRRAGRPEIRVKVEPSDEGYRTSEARDHLTCQLLVAGRVGVRDAKATLVVREGDSLGTTSPTLGERHRVTVNLERVGGRWQGRLPLPPRGAALFTFELGHVGLYWELTCELSVPKRPDLVVVHPLSARPA